MRASIIKGSAMSSRPLALVTGASGGIGESIARTLAARGYDLMLVARTEERLDAIAVELSSSHGTKSTVIAMDLAGPDAGHRLSADVLARGIAVDVLVNNAGFADYGSLWEANAEKLDEMIRLNIATLTELMHDLLPGMVERGSGRVMNIASTAAFLPGPLMAVYYASKAYVLHLSEAVNEELKGTGVTVTAVCPGPTESGFVAKAEMETSKLFKGAIMDTDTVARCAVSATLKGTPVAVVGLKNKFTVLSPRFLPRRIVPGIVKKAQAASH
jgi:uncharacterized protein